MPLRDNHAMRIFVRALAALMVLLPTPQTAAGSPDADSFRDRLEGIARALGTDTDQRWHVSAWHCGSRLGIEWRTADGRLSASEDVILQPGSTDRLAGYRLSRENVGQHVEGTVRDGMLELRIRAAGKARVARLALTPGLLAGPMLVRYAHRNLAALRAGRELRMDYLLGESGAVIGLQMRVESGASDGPGTTVRIDAASMLMRPFVPTTRLTFSAEDTLVRVTGRLLPQAGTVDAPTPVDGELRIRDVQATGGCGPPAAADPVFSGAAASTSGRGPSGG